MLMTSDTGTWSVPKQYVYGAQQQQLEGKLDTLVSQGNCKEIAAVAGLLGWSLSERQHGSRTIPDAQTSWTDDGGSAPWFVPIRRDSAAKCKSAGVRINKRPAAHWRVLLLGVTSFQSAVSNA